jgi:hypothetical protein
MIVQETMGQLLHKVWPKKCTGDMKRTLEMLQLCLFLGGACGYHVMGSHSVLQIFQVMFICYPHYLLKLWCRGSHSLLRLVQTIYI